MFKLGSEPCWLHCGLWEGKDTFLRHHLRRRKRKGTKWSQDVNSFKKDSLDLHGLIFLAKSSCKLFFQVAPTPAGDSSSSSYRPYGNLLRPGIWSAWEMLRSSVWCLAWGPTINALCIPWMAAGSITCSDCGSAHPQLEIKTKLMRWATINDQSMILHEDSKIWLRLSLGFGTPYTWRWLREHYTSASRKRGSWPTSGVVRCPFGYRFRASFGMKSLKLVFLCEKCKIGASHFSLEQALSTPLGDSCESRLTCS